MSDIASGSTPDEAALNALLDREPRSVDGWIGKGDCRLAARDVGAAAYFYRTALRLAAEQGMAVENSRLSRAAERLATIEHEGDEQRTALMRSRGAPPEGWSSRFAQAMDHAAGRRRRFPQDPTAFFYPGLPTIEFFDPAAFAWTAAVEAAAPAIRAELLALIAADTDFRAYLGDDVGAVPLGDNRRLVLNKDWSVLALCEAGWVDPALVQRCPVTWSTLLAAPIPRVSGWGPTVTFSLLKAGAHIAPHTGMHNSRLICHLPLIVPEGCRFRVGNEVREWVEGKLFIFDDTIEHEAWNDGGEDRIVLIFDIWRPELSEQERGELTRLFSD
ncbi:aspartyl/asparaginyl beta-hydroxylase domain-containing protein [Sphingomonas ginkgonis]|uniref:Aspartyl/asparaginyl beta-hydroxylase domain-containing protein n=1 Tax=Sphingomonas ginkgonis TaxID=2315330 RepID=A0A429VDC6_9SPHN|nr:aspartyl/asparaginyl beta-hydroxylase domain-containing protein [Sphingomonas ginkgonis]RST31944.1 aspartyl/asparaginyl beta-hydroxylase domain-containing protein [Sphingomonas ginkgonis]